MVAALMVDLALAHAKFWCVQNMDRLDRSTDRQLLN